MGTFTETWARHLLLYALIGVWMSVSAKLVYVEEYLPLPGEESPPGSPWPLPRSWTSSPQLLTIDPEVFTISPNLKGCEVIDAAEHRYHALTLIDPTATFDPNLPLLKTLLVNVTSGCDHTPHLNHDPNYESYTLDVEVVGAGEMTGADGQIVPVLGEGVATIVATTVWGALRAMETFSQLVFITEPQRRYYINATKVDDAPRFPHRGLLVDTARHFLPKDIMLKVLDSMEWNKLNVLHWHIVDDQSFPYESRIFPNLTQYGAYTPRHVYNQEDVTDIVQYARYRGIRIIPEFDTPGHAQGFGKAFPHLLTPCYGDGLTPGTANYPYHSAYENLDPTNPQVYAFMKAFLVDLVHSTFVDGYVHLGLDEVFLTCWSTSPVVRAFMTLHNYTHVRDVETHYVEKILELAEGTPLNYITWQDPADRGINMSKTSVVQVWKDVSLSTNMRGWRDYVHDLTEAGRQVILSSCWYISYVTYGQDWRNFYNCDPTDFQGTPEQKALVLGGEAAMWGQYVDATNLLTRLWPRASAAAERLWSVPLSEAPSLDSAAYRLDQHRCRMLRRGVPAQPILNGYCGEWEVPQNVPMSTPPPPTPTPTPSTTPSTTTSTTTTTPTTTTTLTTTTTITTNPTTTTTTTPSTTTAASLTPPITQPTAATPAPPAAPQEAQPQVPVSQPPEAPTPVQANVSAPVTPFPTPPPPVAPLGGEPLNSMIQNMPTAGPVAQEVPTANETPAQGS